MQNLRDAARNPLSMGEVDRAIFSEPGSEPAGSLAELDSGRVVARPTSIMAIYADPKQPRRAIPASIRLHWDGDPLEVVPMLGKWHLIAEAEAGITLDIASLLNGEGEGLDADKFPSLAQEYLALVRLAQGIKADGLINPITVIESDGKLLIESGERRWLAYHLLNTYLGDQWAKIPAAKGNVNDSIWRQATENTQRRALNAIGMARQIALLVMETRSTGSQITYKTYEEMTAGGLSDRRFYAQVADGSVHRIPRGMGERIQGAMALGMEQISQYRALLRLTTDEQINDAIWTKADVENWPEGWLRDLRTLTPVKVSEVISRANWTIDDLRALKEVPPPATLAPITTPTMTWASEPDKLPIEREWLGKAVRSNQGRTGIVTKVDGGLIKVKWDDDGSQAFITYKALHFLPPRTIAPDMPPAPPVTIEPGDTVETRLGTIGIVKAVNGREILIDTQQRGIMRQNLEHLTLVQKAGFVPQIDEAAIEADVDPDATPTERPWSEGISIGHNNQLDSEKADSDGQVEPKMITGQNNTHWYFIQQLVNAAEVIEDYDTESALQRLMLFTDVEAIQLHDAQQLRPALDEAFQQVRVGMDAWLNEYIAAICQKIMDAAQ